MSNCRGENIGEMGKVGLYSVSDDRPPSYCKKGKHVGLSGEGEKEKRKDSASRKMRGKRVDHLYQKKHAAAHGQKQP